MRRSTTIAGLVAAPLIAMAVVAQSQTPPFPPLAPLGPPPTPVDSPQTAEAVELGRMLFFDNRLSGNAQMGCAMCHRPDLGWGTGGAISFGYPGTIHWRNSQTILNSAYYSRLFWDGAVTSLEAQAPAAAGGAVAGNGDDALMEMRLAFVPEYRERFRQIYGTDYPRIYDAWRAISAFQRTIVTDTARVPFDRFARGDRMAMTDSAQRGMALFNGQAGCIACHNGPLASDQRFYRTGVPEPETFRTDPVQQITHRWEVYQKGVDERTYRTAIGDHGLFYVTKRPEDVGRWRTPSLRELRWTGPFMHNGAFETLAEVVAFYNRGGGPGAERLRPLGLTDQQQADLVAFLEALSMDEPLLMDDPVLPPTEPLWRRD